MTRLGLAALTLVLVASEPRPPSAAGVPALPGASGSGGSIQSAAPDLALEVPRARQTGTTIAGVVCRDGVVLGADTRATEGTTVCDKRCDKVHRLAPNIFCCAAGTSADAEQLTRSTALDLWLLREEAELATPFGHELPISSVSTALWHLQLRLAQSSAQCHIVLGGMDACGPSLFQLHAAGNSDPVPFTALGSGACPAIAVLETRYRDDLSVEEAEALMLEAISAGIENDLGSGSDVDLCVITADGVRLKRRVWSAREHVQHLDRAAFDRWARDTSMGEVDWDGLGSDAPREHGVVRQIGRGEFRPRRASDLRVDLGLWEVAPSG